MRLEHLLSGAKNNRLSGLVPEYGVDQGTTLGYACYEIDTLYLALVPDSLVAQLVRAPH